MTPQFQDTVLVAKAHRKLAMNAESKLLSLEDYCSSETCKIKERAIKKWKKELEVIQEEKHSATRFSCFEGHKLETVAGLGTFVSLFMESIRMREIKCAGHWYRLK